MSESNEHREMVLLMAKTLQNRYIDIRVSSDMRNRQGNCIPHIINGYRPDIIAFHGKKTLIGEAKTSKDIKSNRSELQIKTFIKSVEQRESSFILGIYGQEANHAKTILRFISCELEIRRCQLEVFDGLDYWALSQDGEKSWHLI